MNLTVTLFQIDFDRFSAVAVDVDLQGSVWTAKYESRADLLRSLDRIGVVTPAELKELQQPSSFAHGAQLFHASLSRDDIEKAGFLPSEPAKSATGIER